MVQNRSMFGGFGWFCYSGKQGTPFVYALLGYFSQNMGLIRGRS